MKGYEMLAAKFLHNGKRIRGSWRSSCPTTIQPPHAIDFANY